MEMETSSVLTMSINELLARKRGLIPEPDRKPVGYGCKLCPKRFYTIAGRKQHEAVVHDAIKSN